jgi:hypothetical protein
LRRTLFLAHHEEDTAPDMYRQMEGNMTVFGFGRDNVPCCPKFMNAVPQSFTVGLAEDSAFASVAGVINGATRPLGTNVGIIQERPSTVSAGPIRTLRKEGSGLPTSVALDQNYPNPFNPVTLVRFGIPEAADVTITVFDMLGRSVGTIAEGTFAAGWHEARFDAAGLASGVYIYRMRTGNHVLTQRLVLLR